MKEGRKEGRKEERMQGRDTPLVGKQGSPVLLSPLCPYPGRFKRIERTKARTKGSMERRNDGEE